MIIAKNLYKEYEIKQRTGKWWRVEKTKKSAVADISLQVPQGEIIGLLGINGAGKTTTIKMLTTMIEPTSGTIHIDEIDAVLDSIEAKKRINLITGGERNIYWRLTAKENLLYFGRLYGVAESVLNPRIDEILKVVELEEMKDIPVEKYSKGMKQRLQIARGLINDPQYIFLDEPTLGLDIVIAKEMRSYIRRLADERKKGVLLTTHYMFEAEELCDYIYVIHGGCLIAEGKPKDIKKKYIQQYKIRFQVEDLNESLERALEKLNHNDIRIRVEKQDHIFEVTSLEDITSGILKIIEESNGSIVNMVVLEASLEDALLNMIGEENERNMAGV